MNKLHNQEISKVKRIVKILVPSQNYTTRLNRVLLNRLLNSLMLSHNSNPLKVAINGLRNASFFQFQAQNIINQSNARSVEFTSYAFRKAKILHNALKKAKNIDFNSDRNFNIALIVFESRKAGNVANDETKAFLKRISAKGSTFSPEEVPEQLKQFI